GVSIYDQFEHARSANPMHPCVVSEDEVWTYDDVARGASRIASALVAIGVVPGHRVGILLKSSPLFVLAFFGVARRGAIPVPLDPRGSSQTLRNTLGDCAPTAILCESETAARIAALPPVSSLRACFTRLTSDVTFESGNVRVQDIPTALQFEAIVGEP